MATRSSPKKNSWKVRSDAPNVLAAVARTLVTARAVGQLVLRVEIVLRDAKDAVGLAVVDPKATKVRAVVVISQDPKDAAARARRHSSVFLTPMATTNLAT